MPHVKSIVYQVAPSRHEEPYRYQRTPADKVTLIANHGIEGDLKAGKNPKRQLNIMAEMDVESLAAEGYLTAPGQLGEQIVITGMALATLKPGDRLQLGKTAVIGITLPRTGCKWFEAIHQRPIPAPPRLGMMARVIRGGLLRVGDRVRLLTLEEA